MAQIVPTSNREGELMYVNIDHITSVQKFYVSQANGGTAEYWRVNLVDGTHYVTTDGEWNRLVSTWLNLRG